MQKLIKLPSGEYMIEGDWYPRALPKNVRLDETAYPDTSYSFTTFFSKKPVGFSLGYGSGNYGHGIFTTGENGEIKIGNYVVLQCTRLLCNDTIQVADHSMFSWGSVVTDSWLSKKTYPVSVRRAMLEQASSSVNRHIEFVAPEPVIINENVWVGFDAIILPGVTIGRGAVIGCKTVVAEDVPPYSVVVGNPGRVIKYLEPNDSDAVRQEVILQFNSHKETL